MLCIVVLPLLRESPLPDVMAGSIGYRFLQAVQSILLERKCSAVLDLGGIIMAKGFLLGETEENDAPLYIWEEDKAVVTLVSYNYSDMDGYIGSYVTYIKK